MLRHNNIGEHNKKHYDYKDYDIWVEQPEFLKQSGYSKDKVRSRRRNGIWLEGVHWKYIRVGTKRRVAINTTAVGRFIKGSY